MAVDDAGDKGAAGEGGGVLMKAADGKRSDSMLCHH
jgi:hypothetical protein